jgi:hypothetical protein
MNLPFLFAAGLLVTAAGTFAQKNSQPAAALPEESHDGVIVSADVYTDRARAKEKLGKADPVAVGLLPIEVFFKNQTDLPVRLNLDTIQLDVRSGAQHQNLDWIDPVEVATDVAHPGGPPSPGIRRFPIGVNIPKDAKRDKILEVLRPFVLDADIVPPNGMIHGFLFFDLGSNPLSVPPDSSLYVPDLTVATTNKPLMFFEVMLGKSATAQP